MPHKSLFRRFRLLLAVLTICIATTAYWGYCQYRRSELKTEGRPTTENVANRPISR